MPSNHYSLKHLKHSSLLVARPPDPGSGRPESKIASHYHMLKHFEHVSAAWPPDSGPKAVWSPNLLQFAIVCCVKHFFRFFRSPDPDSA